MVTKKSPRHVPKTRNIEDMIRRTPPHLLREHSRKHPNMNVSTCTSLPIGQFGYGSSCLPLQDHSMYKGIMPPEGENMRYLYLPLLLSVISKASSSSCEGGTPRSRDTEHPSGGGSKSGGSNSRTADYHPPYQLSSFYPVAPCTNGNDNWCHSQLQELAHLHCNEPGRGEQLPLPSYGRSHDTNTNINSTTSTMETSPLILGKRPTGSNPSESFFQQPPTRKPHHAPDMGPEFTDDLFSLVQSVGTPEFLSSWEKVFGSGSSMYEPHYASSIHAMAGSSGTASEPSLTLGLGNDSSFDKGKGKKVHFSCELSATTEMGESMKKQRKETDQPSSKLTLGLDGHGGSKSTG